MKKIVKIIPAPMIRFFEKHLRNIPFIKRRIDAQIDDMFKHLESSLKPYRTTSHTHLDLPEKGVEKESLINEIIDMNRKEDRKWKKGFVSGAVYHGDSEHIAFLNRVYALTSQSNPLHSDLWPSAAKFESEIVQMTANLLSAKEASDEVCGTITSGGTESILLAMKTYRDQAREKKRIKKPELVVPVTGHTAFDKACQYFNIKKVHVPVDENFRADIKAVEKAVNKNTIAIVGSAPSFPHGIVDPIAEMSQIALDNNIGFHTDACLGGFVLPFIEKLYRDRGNRSVPLFDFRLKGVTSISIDTHKYGYAAKGTSVIVYRNRELRRFQYYTVTDWPGGLYFSPTFAGSRPGALSAACWASMLSIGENGYLEATRKIMDTAEKIKQEIKRIPDLHIMGNPLWVIAFGSEKLDIYKILDQMTLKGWSLNGLHKPSCIHIAVTVRHTRDGVAERFIRDLEESVIFVREHPGSKGGMAPVYGMAATLPAKGIVSDILKRYLDTYYKA